MKVLVTGAAGFIGFHTSKKLLERGDTVIGIDNLNDYYDPKLKDDRLQQITNNEYFKFIKLDIADRDKVLALFEKEKPERVINLAAQAGVRHSLTNPYAYVDSNLYGFINILEGCRYGGVNHLVYASSSSVYGSNRKMPFSVNDNVDHPVSLYAATKKANELMAHTYSHLYSLPTTGLRFFTVYGPWGRPDMAYFKFTRAIIEGIPINVYNYGKMKRDFTFIYDIVEGIVRVLEKIPIKNEEFNTVEPLPSESDAPYRVYNIGNNNPVELMYFIECIEKELGKSAIKNFLPLQKGDVLDTFADIDALFNDVGFKPSTSIEVGIHNFVKWYREYFR